MKKVLFLSLLLFSIINSPLSIFHCQLSIVYCQSWQELMDSTEYYVKAQDYLAALPFAEKALTQAEKEFSRQDTNYIASLFTVYYCHYYLGNSEKAIEFCEKAKPIIKEVRGEESREYALAVNDLGFFYEVIGKYAAAEPLLQEAMETRRLIFKTDHPALATSINNLANFYYTIGNNKEAEPLFKEALEMFRRIYKTDHPALASSINNLAAFHNDKGNYKEAELLYKEALEMRRRIFKTDHPSLAESINNMAYFYEDIGNYKEAESLYKEALEMKRRIYKGDHPNLALSINNMAMFYNAIGNYKEAESLLKEALEMKRRIYKGDHPDLALSINNMAYFYEDIGNYKEVESLCKEALEMRRRIYKTNHPDLAQSINNMATFYNDIGNYKEAETLFREVLEMDRRLLKSDHPDLARSINNIACFYYGRGNYKEAEPLYDESMKICLNLINNYFPSLSEKEKGQYFSTFSVYYAYFNNFAVKRYKQNPKILCHMYDNSLLTKGILLNSTNKVKDRILRSNDSVLIDNYRLWQGKKEQLAKLYSLPTKEVEKQGYSIDSLEKIANELEKELSRRSEAFSSEYDKKILTWQDIQKTLKPNEAAVEIIRIASTDKNKPDSTIYAALIITKLTKTAPKLVLLKNGNELETKYISQYSDLIKAQRIGNYKKEELQKGLKEIHNQFWGRIKGELAGIKKVYISPDGVYNKINLNTLINPKTGKYLLDEMDIQMITSTRDLAVMNTPLNPLSRGENKTAALFGDPDYGLDKDKQKELANKYVSKSMAYYDLTRSFDELTPVRLAPLPGTRREVEAISGKLSNKGWNVEQYLGADALEEAVKAVQSPVVLHIATHGEFLKDVKSEEPTFGFEEKRLAENPLLRSMLLFSGADRALKSKGNESSETDDGLLTAYEAMNLNLDSTELVVLSACETGLGEIKNGEGVYGLQRAFRQAGAKTLIMSLWNVSDEATQDLMSRFYEKWLSGMTKREAFKKAQLEIKIKYKSPYYWGAFILVGD